MATRSTKPAAGKKKARTGKKKTAKKAARKTAKKTAKKKAKKVSGRKKAAKKTTARQKVARKTSGKKAAANKKTAASSKKKARPSRAAKSSDFVPKVGQKVIWHALPGDVEGEVVRILTEDTTSGGKKIRATPDDPRIELKSSHSGKICYHKPQNLRPA